MHPPLSKIILVLVTVLYLAILLQIIVFKYPPGMTFDVALGNYVPLKTILYYMSGQPTWGVAIRNLVGNVALFIPLGCLLSFLYRPSHHMHTLVIAVLGAALMEGLQILFRTGILDIDDILLNTFGILLGYAIVAVGRKAVA